MTGELSLAELLLRVSLAVAAGAMIGLERELSDRAAGLRTHILVALGACLFTVTGVELAAGSNMDPSRIAAQVASGIGFLGAGAILRDRFRVQGLTTAATLWVTAALGVLAGSGAYGGALVAIVVLALVVLAGLKWLENLMTSRWRSQTIVLLLEEEAPIGAVTEAVHRILPSFSASRVFHVDTGGHRVLGSVRFPRGADVIELADEIQALPGVRGVDLMQ